MISVVIIGGGNVASHLTNAFLKVMNICVIQVFSRDINNIKYLRHKTSITDNIENLIEADVYIIAVSDDAIGEVSSMIKIKNALVLHTSGNIAMSSLQNDGRKGIFYPLQSFSKDRTVNFSEIPLCVEAENEKDLILIETLAKTIGNKIYHINSKQRKSLHIAAVFVNNFVNYLYTIGNDICDENNVPFKILHPLIEETAKKIQFMSSVDAQTGPAKRNDQKTIENHLENLNNQQQEIYKLLTKYIQNN